MLVKTPTQATLKKYGLSEYEWEQILLRQGGACAVCGDIPKSLRLHIDHEHVKGWRKMPAEERKKFVRGLVCYRDNRFFLARGMDIDRSRAITRYLLSYQIRRAA